LTLMVVAFAMINLVIYAGAERSRSPAIVNPRKRALYSNSSRWKRPRGML